MKKELYPIEDTANILHVTKWTIYRLVKSGKLKNVRYNTRTQFFRRDEIERYARENGFQVDIPEKTEVSEW